MYPLTLGISDSQIIPGLVDAYLAKVLAVGGTLTSTEEGAVYQLVDDFEAAGIIDKFDIFMPILGGTDASCKINLFDPNNTLYDWDYLGTPTFSSTGIKGNGTDAAVRSLFKINDLQKATPTDSHLAYYKKYYALNDAHLEGCLDTEAGYIKMAYCYYYGPYGGMWTGNFSSSVSVTDFNGLVYSEGRSSAPLQRAYINNTLKSSMNETPGTFSSTSGLAMLSIYWFIQNASHVYVERNPDEIRSWSIGSGFTDTQRTDYYNAIETFQTTIGRNV